MGYVQTFDRRFKPIFQIHHKFPSRSDTNQPQLASSFSVFLSVGHEEPPLMILLSQSLSTDEFWHPPALISWSVPASIVRKTSVGLQHQADDHDWLPSASIIKPTTAISGKPCFYFCFWFYCNTLLHCVILISKQLSPHKSMYNHIIML